MGLKSSCRKSLGSLELYDRNTCIRRTPTGPGTGPCHVTIHVNILSSPINA